MDQVHLPGRNQPGEVIFWEGEPCAGLRILQTGSIKLLKISRQGGELILRILTADATRIASKKIFL